MRSNAIFFLDIVKACYLVCILLTSQMLQLFTTQKFTRCEAQCVHNAFGSFESKSRPLWFYQPMPQLRYTLVHKEN